jgi:hypothetical protein
MQFTAVSGQTYTIQYREAFDAAHPWVTLTNLGPQAGTGPVVVTNFIGGASPARFYRILNPAVP